MIKVINVTKSFSGEKVLDNVSIEVEKGSICGLLGRNGSGKTVLLKCICGFVKPDKGTIKIKNIVVDNKRNNASNMGIIIETPGFLENETAKNNLKYLALLNMRIRIKDIENILCKVGLNPHNKKAVKNYSLGMRQRLAIAQAIMENQEIILLDEPMNGLDQAGVEAMRTLFLELKKEGKTILMATHNIEDIQLLCDMVYRPDGGRIID